MIATGHGVRQVPGLPAAGAHRGAATAPRRPTAAAPPRSTWPRPRPWPHDQLAADRGDWPLPGVRAATYDGDTPPEERRWIRDHANLVLTNPDLLHHSLLPGHERWAPFLRALRYVVVDECHVYRGVFGSHLAPCCAGCDGSRPATAPTPTFVLASATVADPASTPAGSSACRSRRGDRGRVAARGDDLRPVGAAARGRRPAASACGVTAARRAARAEAADLLAELVAQGVQTVAFARSRAGVEVTGDQRPPARWQTSTPRAAERRSRPTAAATCPRSAASSSSGLRAGRRVGLAATNALELGVDVSGLDAVLLAGWPGTAGLAVAAGGAGRPRGRASRWRCFVAADDPLDTYLVHHPEAIFGAAVEATRPRPRQPPRAGPAPGRGRRRAAADRGGPADVRDRDARRLLDALVARGILRRRPDGLVLGAATTGRPTTSRCAGAGDAVRIVEARTGRVLGTVDEAPAHTQVHTGRRAPAPGRAPTWSPSSTSRTAVRAGRGGDPGWTTHAQSVSAVRHRRQATAREQWAPVQVSFRHGRGAHPGHRRSCGGCRRGEVLGAHPLDLPERALPTKAVWWTLPEDVLAAAGSEPRTCPGPLHAAEHAAIGMLPLVATSDRWDVGGVSSAAPRHRPADGAGLRRPSRRRGLRRARATRRSGSGLTGRCRRFGPAGAGPGARRACSRPSAATATSR